MRLDRSQIRTMDEHHAISWPHTFAKNINVGHALCRAFQQGKDYMRAPDAHAWWPGRFVHGA